MGALILDIETVGEQYDLLDETTQQTLTQWIQKEATSQSEYEHALEQLKNGLGFSPLTGEIVAIGVLDDQKNKGTVYFQAPGGTPSEFQEQDITFKMMTEVEMLEHFWNGAASYQEFVTFNGRAFDVPFLMIRSAIYGIRPSKDLMANRYLTSQPFNAKHIDLLDQLTFYSAMRTKGSLHLWCRAFGIQSPKVDGVTGDDVRRLYSEKKFADIARYNVGDLHATQQLYHRWRDKLLFSK